MFCRLLSKIIFLLDKFLDYCIMFIFFNHYCTRCNNYPSQIYIYFFEKQTQKHEGKEKMENKKKRQLYQHMRVQTIEWEPMCVPLILYQMHFFFFFKFKL